jgi:hypothetical protein
MQDRKEYFMKKSIFHSLMSVICDHSVHQWDEWVLLKQSCVEMRTCKRCNSHETRNVEHTWGEGIFLDKKCIQIYECVNCGDLEERRADHLWGEWYPKSCIGKKMRDCQRCHKRETAPASHVWGVWRDGQCEKIRECQNCGMLDKTPAHDWGNWAFGISTCIKKRKCKNCGTVEQVPDKNASENLHSYKFVTRTDKESHKIGGGDDWLNKWTDIYECKICGKVLMKDGSDW